MSKIALHLGHTPVAKKVTFGRTVVTSMTGNVDFASPDVPLAQITAVTDALDQAGAKSAAAHKAWLEAASAERDAETRWDDAIRGEARYVERASGGDATKIKSAGFETAAAPVHGEGTLPAPTNLSATTGDHPGQIDLHWDRVAGARAYQIATADSPDGPFVMAQPSTRSKATLESIPSGKKIWVRVAAFDAHGLGAWSAPVQATAP